MPDNNCYCFKFHRIKNIHPFPIKVQPPTQVTPALVFHWGSKGGGLNYMIGNITLMNGMEWNEMTGWESFIRNLLIAWLVTLFTNTIILSTIITRTTIYKRHEASIDWGSLPSYSLKGELWVFLVVFREYFINWGTILGTK